MFSDLASLQTELLTRDPPDFVSHYLFEPVPFVFKGDLALWISWKTELARLIDVDPRDIVLTGSAAVGYSLNPNKKFKSFDEKSDVDCGIIRPYYFDSAWRHLRQMRPSWLMLNQESKRAIRIHQKTYVFAGTVATDSILGLLPFGRQWQGALDRMGARTPTEGRDVKMRIYRDFDALRFYQSSGILKLRSRLGEAENEELEIEIEEG